MTVSNLVRGFGFWLPLETVAETTSTEKRRTKGLKDGRLQLGETLRWEALED